MPLGRGRYDAACELAMHLTRAKGVLLIVLGGEAGDGFSASGTPDVIMGVPEVLRSVADSIERDRAAFRTAADAFAAHLDKCGRCRAEPFNLCADGDRLLKAAGVERPAAKEGGS